MDQNAWCLQYDRYTKRRDRDRETERERRKGLYHVLSPKLTHQKAPLYALETSESGTVDNRGFPLTHDSHTMETRGSAKEGSHLHIYKLMNITRNFPCPKDLNTINMSPRLAVYSPWETANKTELQKQKKKARSSETKLPSSQRTETIPWCSLENDFTCHATSHRGLSPPGYLTSVFQIRGFVKLTLGSRHASEDADTVLVLFLSYTRRMWKHKCRCWGGGWHASNQEEAGK